MPKSPLTSVLAATAALAALASCTPPPPPPPPPRFKPNPPFAPDPIQPGQPGYDVSPPPTGQTPPPEPEPAPGPSIPGQYPVARATDHPDQVISPFPPYNVIDISGPPRIASGKLAKDPSNGKIFRVP